MTTDGRRSRRFRTSFLPIPALIILMAAVYLTVDPSVFYDPPWLILIGNTLFVTIVSLVVSYIASKNYSATGRIQILMLGCGVLAFGVGGFLAAIVRDLPGGANLNVTIYNTGALIGAAFHFVAAFILLAGISSEVGFRRRGTLLFFGYAGSVAFMAILTAASLEGMTPLFFIQGAGPTLLRQLVLGSADILFVFSFLIFIGTYLRNKEGFLYWYACALALTAISLTAFFIQSSVGSPVGWVGRFSQYVAGAYFLASLVTASRTAHMRGTSLDNVLTASLSGAEEKFRALAENAPDAIRRFDREQKQIYVNSAGMRLYEKPASDIIGRPLQEAGLPDLQFELWTERIRKVFETGQPIEVEDYLPTKKGTAFYQSECVPEYGPDGTVANVLVVSRDLTERKKVEEDLKESEARYRTLFETMTEGFAIDELIFDEANRPYDLRYLAVNPAFEHQTGLKAEDIIGRTTRELFPEAEPEWFDRYGKVVLTGEPAHFESWFGPLGRCFEVYAFRTEPGRFATIFMDITERKRALEALRQSEEKLSALYASMVEGVALHDMVYDEAANPIDYIITFVNPSFEKITGLSIDNALGKRASALYGTGKPPYLDVYARVASSAKPEQFETYFEPMKKHFNISAFSPSPGKFATVFSDITERMQIEEELRRSKDELEHRVHERTADLSSAKEELEVINEELQVEISEHEKTEKELIAAKEAAEAAVEAKAAFLANMSHELRTPLNAVIGYSSLLLDDNLTNEQKENIESIKNGGEALLAIISDILEFSRAEKEKITLEKQTLSIKRCIEESLEMVAVQAGKKDLDLAYTISYGTPDTIIGDPGRLRQILVNLLSNAIKFTDVGEVSVSVSAEALEDNKRRITFEVMDTGIGMPQDKMDRLFEPFTQLEYVISRKRDGAGLGLAISRKLVELMGGKIWAESEEGKGSTFRFTITAEIVQSAQMDYGYGDSKEDATYKDLSVQNPLSILVAEDNPSNQKVLVEMLKRLGYRPDAVADGVEVLQALKIRPYDLIFMDIRMPEMDGLTATKEIRRLMPDNGPKIVAITAFAMEGDRERCLEAGMDGYISKPVRLEELKNALSVISPSGH
jgi:PAS domain S-box-containing protein